MNIVQENSINVTDITELLYDDRIAFLKWNFIYVMQIHYLNGNI